MRVKRAIDYEEHAGVIRLRLVSLVCEVWAINCFTMLLAHRQSSKSAHSPNICPTTFLMRVGREAHHEEHAGVIRLTLAQLVCDLWAIN